jgi:Zn-dependent alcohol dehydrogenase
MLVSGKDVGLQVYTEKPSGHVFMSYKQNAGKCRRIKMGNKSLENVVTFMHL